MLPDLHFRQEKVSHQMAGAMATRRVQPQEKRDVAFVVRAPDPNNKGRWITVGAAWERKNGEPGYNIKLNSVPVGAWDGALIMLPPITPSAEEAEREVMDRSGE
jgi:hypothetical protein